MNIQQLTRFKRVLLGANACPITVTLDWLSVLFKDEAGNIPAPPSEEFTHQVDDNITLVYTGKGNEHYKHIYNVQHKGEHLATILAHTRNKKFVSEGTIKIDFKNHLLYSSELWPLYDELIKAFSLKYVNISRVDIAIDGMNYLIEFMNMYMKQTAGQKAVNMVNRARFNANVLDQKTMNFQNFLVGSKKGTKKITIYNKSLDIVKTGKNYIQLFWKQNKMIERLIDIQAQQEEIKKDKEKMYLDGEPNIYRFELRLKGETVKSIAGFNMAMLKTPEGLMSIMRLMTNNFFEFRTNTYQDGTKNEPLIIIPFNKFNIENLEKIPRQEREDLYKTKLSINRDVKAYYLGKLLPENAAAYEMLKFSIRSFDLQKWFRDKVTMDWQRRYAKQAPATDYADHVTEFLHSVIFELTPEVELIKLDAEGKMCAEGREERQAVIAATMQERKTSVGRYMEELREYQRNNFEEPVPIIETQDQTAANVKQLQSAAAGPQPAATPAAFIPGGFTPLGPVTEETPF